MSDITYKGNASLSISSPFPFKIERVRAMQTSSKTHHYHDSYEIYYLYQGDRCYFIKDKTYHIKRGNLVLIKQYDIHSTTSFQTAPYERTLINFKKEYIRELLEEVKDYDLFDVFKKDIHVIQLNFKEQRIVEGVLQSMLDEYNAKEDGYEYFLKTSRSLSV